MISYDDYSNRCLKVARRSKDGWVIEVVDRTGAPGSTSLAFDPAGIPSIAYTFQSSRRRELCLARHDGAGWKTSVIASDGTGAKGVALAISATGVPYVSYSDVEKGALRLAEFARGTWRISDAIDKGFCSGISLRFCPVGDPTISYEQNGILKIASRSQGVWGIQRVDWKVPTDQHTPRVANTSLEFDGEGRPHISFSSRLPVAVLRLTQMRGDTWQTEIIDKQTMSGNPSALAQLSNGKLAIAYIEAADAMNAKLNYAVGGPGKWQISVVDRQVGANYQIGLVHDRDGSPMISYYDLENRSLKFAELDHHAGGTD